MSSQTMIKLTICITMFFSFYFLNVTRVEAMPLQANVYVDEKPVNTDYILEGGHLYVPAIFFKYAGSYVNWNEQYEAVIFHHKEKMISIPLGKKNYYEFHREQNVWEEHPLTEMTVKVNGKVYVPLVTIANELGMDVTYDANSKTTYVTSNFNVQENKVLHGDDKWKLVALTFDDGPDIYYTPLILDVLKEKGVPATFFMMGKNIKRHPEQVKRIVNEGHAIGNHSYNHPDFSKTWTQDVIEEIQSTQYEIMRVVGTKPDIIRPPYGATTKADIAVLNRLGLRNILWSVDTLDWQGKSGDEILEIVEEQIFPGGIVLQHNFGATGGELQGTIDALPKIIDDLQEEGYTFVTVQTLLDVQKFHSEN